MVKIKVFGVALLIFVAVFAGVKYSTNDRDAGASRYKDDYTGISFSGPKEWGGVIKQDPEIAEEDLLRKSGITKTSKKMLKLGGTIMESGEMIRYDFADDLAEGDGNYFNLLNPKPTIFAFSSDFKEISEPEGDGSQFYLPTGVSQDILNNPSKDSLKDFACSRIAPRIFGHSKEFGCESILVDGKKAIISRVVRYSTDDLSGFGLILNVFIVNPNSRFPLIQVRELIDFDVPNIENAENVLDYLVDAVEIELEDPNSRLSVQSKIFEDFVNTIRF